MKTEDVLREMEIREKQQQFSEQIATAERGSLRISRAYTTSTGFNEKLLINDNKSEVSENERHFKRYWNRSRKRRTGRNQKCGKKN